jgi:hypothetical protein
LWDARPPVQPTLTATVQGNRLTLQRPTNLLGVFLVEVTASDGLASSKRTFRVTLN